MLSDLQTPLQNQAARRAAKAAAFAFLPKHWLVRRGPQTKNRIALTFDDGPCAESTAYLEILHYFGVRATFFVVGSACRERASELSRIAALGHEVAGHGYTHRRFPTLSSRELMSELARTSELLPEQNGRRLVRPPHGTLSPSVLLTCARAGYTTVLWSRDSADWRVRSSAELVQSFRRIPPEAGDILLFHEGQPWTLAALPEILSQLLEAGHELVTVGELLAS
jgi:peptidoglycan/xylan/chitin deacetylase (PgdA/CDA1 family)